MKKKILNFLGLAKRAGYVRAGEELVYQNIKEAKVCYLASDVGPSTKKKVLNKCEFYKVEVIMDYTREELSQAIGQNRVCLVVLNRGFARKLINMRGENNDKNSSAS